MTPRSAAPSAPEMLRAIRLLLSLGLVISLGCRSEPTSILEQERVPDAAGVVEDVGPAGLKLAGGQGYEIDSSVQAFTTRSHDEVVLGALKGRYVHLGLNDQDRVVWIASIGIVPSGQDRVYYTGVPDRTEDGTAYFEDGTVLRVDPGVELPEPAGEWAAVLDVSRGVVVEVERQG